MKCDDDNELFYNSHGCELEVVKYFIQNGLVSCYCQAHSEEFIKECTMFRMDFKEISKEEYLIVQVIES